MKKLLLCLSFCGITSAGNFDDLFKHEIQDRSTIARKEINGYIDLLLDQAYDKGTKTPQVAQTQNVVKIPVFARVRTYEASDFNGNTFPAKNCLITFGTSDKTDNLHAIQSNSYAVERWTGTSWLTNFTLLEKENPDEDLYFKMKEIARGLTESESPQQIGVVLIPRDQIGSIEEYRSNQTPATVLENHFSQQLVLNTIPEDSKDLSNYPPLPKHRALEILHYLAKSKLIDHVKKKQLATLIYWASKPTSPISDRLEDIADREDDTRSMILAEEKRSCDDLRLEEYLDCRKAYDKELVRRRRSLIAEHALVFSAKEHERFMRTQAEQLAAARSLRAIPSCRLPLPH